MGNCCQGFGINKTISSIEYEEYDNYIPMMLGIENIKTSFKEKFFSMRKSMSISVKS